MPPYVPALDHVAIAQADWAIHDQQSDSCGWRTAQGISIRLRLVRQLTQLPFNPGDAAGAQRYFAPQMVEQGAALLDLECGAIAGVDALWGVFKFPPIFEGQPGLYYVGLIWLLRRDFCFKINIEAREQHHVGMREATIQAEHGLVDMVGHAKPRPASRPVTSGAELFAAIAAARRTITRHPADAAEYDARFPDHPLSQVRALLRECRATARLHPLLAAQPAYHI